MFFIVNHENSIIAADADFLEGIGADNIYDAALLIKNGEVVLDELEQSITYFQQSRGFAKVQLSTFLGDAYLYEINEEMEEEEGAEEETVVAPQEEVLFNLAMPQADLLQEEETDREDLEATPEIETETEEEAIFSLTEEGGEPTAGEASPAEESESSIELDEQNDVLLQIDTPETPVFDLDDAETAPVEKEKIGETTASDEILGLIETDSDISKEEDLLAAPIPDLDLEEAPLSFLESAEETEEEEEALSIMEEHVTPPAPEAETATEVESTEAEAATEARGIPEEITEELTQTSQTNFQEIAALIGVSEEEYLHFLDDFVKESSQLESSLRSNDLKESREALAILKEASLLLHLPQITEKLNTLSNATSDEKSSIVDSYLTLVAQVRSGTVTQAPLEEADTVLSPEPNETELSQSETGADKEEMLAVAESVPELLDQASFSLDQVQAIPFDFSINEAADELTLPASLVSEFVVDFINQAKENLPVIQNAYENKDLETIQTTAHMLKGASSNLRIVPMAETLYQLQFNEEIARVPELLAHFAGQLKALTLQMDQA